MANCPGCGEPLTDPCPVCAALDLPAGYFVGTVDGGNMSDEAGKEGAGKKAMLEPGPLLGDAAKTGSVRVNFDTQIIHKAGEAPPASPEPVTGQEQGAVQSDYQRELEEPGSDAYCLKRLEKYRQNGTPMVLFMGMRTTGKTWMLLRMKQILYNSFACDTLLDLPAERMTGDEIEAATIAAVKSSEDGTSAAPVAPAKSMSQKEQADANKSDRTGRMLFHEFKPVHKGQGKAFVLIDVPGEDFLRLAEKNYSDLRRLSAALKYAGTVIVALPSDITLLADHINRSAFDSFDTVASLREDKKLVQKLTDALVTLSKLRSHMLVNAIDIQWKPIGGPADEYDRQVTAEAVEDHEWDNGRIPFGGDDGMDCPVFIALTKADKFFAAAGTLPDITHATGLPADLIVAHDGLRHAPDGPLLARLFATSKLNTENLLKTPNWVSKIWSGLFPTGGHVAQISNPPEMIQLANPALFNRLVANFPMSKMDLVSAFYGHTGQTLCHADLDNYPQAGMNEMSEWLSRVHNKRLHGYHIWARRVFARIYMPKGQAEAMVGGGAPIVHAKRIRFLWPQLLAAMFRKEYFWVQSLLGLGGFLLAACAVLWTNFGLMENQSTVGAERYKAFATEVQKAAPQAMPLAKPVSKLAKLAAGATAIDEPETDPIDALAALPFPDTAFDPRKERDKIEQYNRALQNPLKGLSGWSQSDNRGSFIVGTDYEGLAGPPPPANGTENNATEQAISELRESQITWQKKHVCGLEGWGDDYRDIVRKAVINGYGDCSWGTRFAMRSPLLNGLQNSQGYAAAMLIGVPLFVLLWALLTGFGYFLFWYVNTRAAYSWLYHSRIATTQRTRKKIKAG